MSSDNSADLNHIQQTICGYFAGREGIAAIYLYGSVVTQTFTTMSDIDIGVLYTRDTIPSWNQRLHDQLELADLLGTDVDLILLNQVSPILGYQVLKKGICILNHDPSSVNSFFVKTLNEYFDLKQVRQVIEKNLRHVSIYD